jgi:hydroxyacylglutathione hydrolase
MKNILQHIWKETADPGINVMVVPVLTDNYSYLIKSSSGVVLVDPGSSRPLFDAVEQSELKIDSVLITHEHHDHTGGLKEIEKRWGAEVFAASGSHLPVAFNEISGDECVQAGDVTFKACFTPGHYVEMSPIGSVNRNVVWYCEKAGALFTGDTLFSCGYGYTTDKYVPNMIASLKFLRQFSDETQVFSGHEYSLLNTSFAAEIFPQSQMLRERINTIHNLLEHHTPTVPTTMEFEKKNNPFLRWDDPVLQKTIGCTDTIDDLGAFIQLRERKMRFNAAWTKRWTA